MSPVIARLARRFSQMKLKEEPVQCAIATSDEEIAHILSFFILSLHLFLQTISQLRLLKHALPFRSFWTHTAIQVTMCSKSTSVSIHLAILSTTPTENGYREIQRAVVASTAPPGYHKGTFEELYGSEPTERDRPSLHQ